MTLFGRLRLPAGSAEQQLSIAQAATEEELRRMARYYRWSRESEPVLGWIMAQKCIDLTSALSVFFNGDPERFNYLPKRDVPEAHLGAARLLDNICLRVNSGFYQLRPGPRIVEQTSARKWQAAQRADRTEGRRGRWVLDETLLQEALEISKQDSETCQRAHLRGTARRLGVAPWALQRLLPRLN